MIRKNIWTVEHTSIWPDRSGLKDEMRYGIAQSLVEQAGHKLASMVKETTVEAHGVRITVARLQLVVFESPEEFAKAAIEYAHRLGLMAFIGSNPEKEKKDD